MASRAVFCLIVAVVTITCAVALPTSDEDVFAINDCQATGDDITLAEVEISDPGHTAGQVGVYFSYPPKGVSPVSEITCLIAKDLLPGSGGDVVVVSGGRTHNFVQLHITSKYRGKADFAITLKGKPPAKK